MIRARAACPSCNTEEEVWIYQSKMVPTNTIICSNCSEFYDANNFICNIMTINNNSTFSSVSVVL